MEFIEQVGRVFIAFIFLLFKTRRSLNWDVYWTTSHNIELALHCILYFFFVQFEYFESCLFCLLRDVIPRLFLYYLRYLQKKTFATLHSCLNILLFTNPNVTAYNKQGWMWRWSGWWWKMDQYIHHNHLVIWRTYYIIYKILYDIIRYIKHVVHRWNNKK